MNTQTTSRLGAAILLATTTFAPLPIWAQAPTPLPPSATNTTPATPLPPVQPFVPTADAPSELPGARPRTNPDTEAGPVGAPPGPRIDPNISRSPADPVAPAAANSFYRNGTTAFAPEPASAPRADQIIRDAKLKVLQRSYETTFSEFMEMEKALVTAPAEDRDALAAKAKALRGFAERLEDEIHKLGDNAIPATATQPRKTGKNLPSLARPPRAIGLAPENYTPAPATGAPTAKPGDLTPPGGGDSLEPGSTQPLAPDSSIRPK